jgi:transcriptional regulator with XRE-family HTH domain
MFMSKKYLPKYQKLAQKLRTARLEAGLTQVEAGKKLKKPQAYLSKIERGERGVDAVELAEFAKAYGKSTDYFVR